MRNMALYFMLFLCFTHVFPTSLSSVSYSAITFNVGGTIDHKIDKYVENICYYFDKNQLIIDQINGNSSLVATALKGNEIMIKQRKKASRSSNKNGTKAAGIFGVYNLPYGSYVAVIKSSIPAPNYMGISDDSKVFDDNISPLLLKMANNLHQIKEIEFILVPSAATSNHNLTIQMRQQEELLLLQDAFSRHNFYYYKKFRPRKNEGYYDVTRSLQANLMNIYNETNNYSNWKGSDERFFWNLNAIQDVISIRNVDNDWIVPVTNALISSDILYFNTGSSTSKESLVLSLVSRRSRLRQGPRYIKRGSDNVGDVANFVETEQILSQTSTGKIASFLQIRGSIPLFWGQPEVWKLKPSIMVERDLTAHATALKTHLLSIFKSYHSSSIYMINLIDKVGTQGELGKWLHAAFDRLQRGDIGSFQTNHKDIDLLLQNIANMISKIDCIPMKIERIPGMLDRGTVTTVDYYCPLTSSEMSYSGSDRNSINNIRLLWFDYHKKCKKSNVDALKEIFPLVNDKTSTNSEDSDSGRHGIDYFSFHNKNVLTFQNNIIRTNCIDCLDRTNVVQTTLARWALIKQLKAFNSRIFSTLAIDSLSLNTDSASGDNCPAESVFRRLWCDNGDNLSLLYAGTHALKRDVTRQGKRTNKGAFDDGVNSALRYFINNYKDAQRQRGIDLILGNHRNYTSNIYRGDSQSSHAKKEGKRHGKRSVSIAISHPANITFTNVRTNHTMNITSNDDCASDFISEIDNLFSEMRLSIGPVSSNRPVSRPKSKKKRVEKSKLPRIIPENAAAASNLPLDRATIAETESSLKLLLNSINAINCFIQKLGVNATSLVKVVAFIILLLLTTGRISVK